MVIARAYINGRTGLTLCKYRKEEDDDSPRLFSLKFRALCILLDEKCLWAGIMHTLQSIVFNLAD